MKIIYDDTRLIYLAKDECTVDLENCKIEHKAAMTFLPTNTNLQVAEFETLEEAKEQLPHLDFENIGYDD